MISYVITVTTIIVLIPIILRAVKTKSDKVTSDSDMLCYPRFYVITGMLIMVMIVLILILMCIQGLGENVAVEIFCFVFGSFMFVSGSWLFLHSINWRLTLGADKLEQKGLIGIIREYSYSDISRIVAFYRKGYHTPEKYKIYIGSKHITIESVVINFNSFERKIMRRLKISKSSIKIEKRMSKW